MKICSFHFLFVPLRPKYKFDILIMKLTDIRKNVVTTYHYTTIGGEELVFENGKDCHKAREKDVREWHSRLISKEYLNCAKGVYLIKCNREMYEGKNFIVFNGMVVCDNVRLDADGKIDDFDGNIFLTQVGRLWSYHIPSLEIRSNVSKYFSNQRNIDGITDCWNKGWFCCTYEKTVDIFVNAIDGGYEIEKLM